MREGIEEDPPILLILTFDLTQKLTAFLRLQHVLLLILNVFEFQDVGREIMNKWIDALSNANALLVVVTVDFSCEGLDEFEVEEEPVRQIMISLRLNYGFDYAVEQDQDVGVVVVCAVVDQDIIQNFRFANFSINQRLVHLDE